MNFTLMSLTFLTKAAMINQPTALSLLKNIIIIPRVAAPELFIQKKIMPLQLTESELFIQKYEALFGEKPSAQIWDLAKYECGGGGGCGGGCGGDGDGGNCAAATCGGNNDDTKPSKPKPDNTPTCGSECSIQ